MNNKQTNEIARNGINLRVIVLIMIMVITYLVPSAITMRSVALVRADLATLLTAQMISKEICEARGEDITELRELMIDSLPVITVVEENIEEEPTEEVVINTTDITQPSNLTAEQFNTLINNVLASKCKTNSRLIGLGDAIYNMEQTYGVNGLLCLSVASLESGWGTSSVAYNKNNLFGIYAKGGNRYFNTIEEGVDYWGNLISKYYISKGYTTIQLIGGKYCETSSWANHVTSLYTTYSSAVYNLI